MDKTVRIKKRIEVKNISKLETVPIVREVFIQNNMSMLNIINTSKVNSCIREKKSLKSSEINDDVFGFSCNDDEQLSAEDIQIFEVENKQLYNDLNILSEEIKQIENKVTKT
ncbi:PREDICTED: syntaxin-18 [Ceratosolen solmsi marchali]|uniref:Syntaxin-18 n=1 Tax=Ceratosolen solmsi marchali TaxID=326594 RepID=A0AAJ6YDP5_9HYME|nr:PREDICTED: syntaxin-18 [Ceratosolen solmsi marchali]